MATGCTMPTLPITSLRGRCHHRCHPRHPLMKPSSRPVPPTAVAAISTTTSSTASRPLAGPLPRSACGATSWSRRPRQLRRITNFVLPRTRKPTTVTKTLREIPPTSAGHPRQQFSTDNGAELGNESGGESCFWSPASPTGGAAGRRAEA